MDASVDTESPAGATPGISVQHRTRVAAVVALAAAVLTVAWFARALRGDGVWEWAWVVLLAVVAVAPLRVILDSRAPLLLADDEGVRVRDGETWNGLRWADIDRVEVVSPGGWLRDGRIEVHPLGGHLAAPVLSAPLSWTTTLRGDSLTGDLPADLDALAGGGTPVVVVVPTRGEQSAQDGSDEAPHGSETSEPAETSEGPEGAPPAVRSDLALTVLSAPHDEDGLVLPHQVGPQEHEQQVEQIVERVERVQPLAPGPRFEPVEPSRAPRAATRSDVVRDRPRQPGPAVAAIPAQRASEGPVVMATLDDVAGSRPPQPARNAVIGPLVRAARNRARLSIDTLSERTRIRPHVLECIEVDDFEPCGGDFYARGHLRTLARMLGLDVEQLLALYDEHYAQPEVEARQVFEAELATGVGGGMRATFSGPRWSLLAACVIALGLVWGLAHVVTAQAPEVVSPAPNVDSAGLTHATPRRTPTLTLAPLGITARGASPQVVVRDKDGRILWAGRLADGRRQQVVGLAPFDVTASNGKAVSVTYLGKPRGTVGRSAAADSKTYGAS